MRIGKGHIIWLNHLQLWNIISLKVKMLLIQKSPFDRQIWKQTSGSSIVPTAISYTEIYLGMIRNNANVCCVQFFVHSTHLLALGLLITEPISMIYNILKYHGVSVIFVRLSVVDGYKASGSETNKLKGKKAGEPCKTEIGNVLPIILEAETI